MTKPTVSKHWGKPVWGDSWRWTSNRRTEETYWLSESLPQ